MKTRCFTINGSYIRADVNISTDEDGGISFTTFIFHPSIGLIADSRDWNYVFSNPAEEILGFIKTQLGFFMALEQDFERFKEFIATMLSGINTRAHEALVSGKFGFAMDYGSAVLAPIARKTLGTESMALFKINTNMYATSDGMWVMVPSVEHMVPANELLV